MLMGFCVDAQQSDSIKRTTDTIKPSIDTNRKAPAQAGIVTLVKGKVMDATGKGLPFVGVSFTGSIYSTHADDKGNFNLSAPGSFHHVVFSNVGYQSITKAIKAGQTNELQLRMKGSQTQLKTVTITSTKNGRYHNKDNPAVSLIQQIINHKAENRMESSDYLQYEEYEQIGMSIFNLSQKFINGRFFSKYKFMLDSTQVINGVKQTVLPAFFSEKLSQYYFRKKPEKSIRIVNAQKQVNILKFIDTAGFNTYLNRLYGNNLDIYENNIFIISNQLLSPIANHSPDFYKFFITDTITTPHGKVVDISFTPRNKGDLLFEGKLQVTLDGHYAVTGCEMSVNKQININFMRSLRIRLDFAKDSASSRYLLTKSDVRADFGLSKDKGFVFFGERSVSYANYKLNQRQSDKFYEGKSEQVTEEANHADTAFLASRRTDKQQTQIYGKVNRLEQMPSFKRTTWIASLITGGYGDWGPIQFGPVGQFFSFNNQEGLRFQVGGRSTPRLSKWLYFEGYGGYGTKDQKPKYDLITYFSLNKVPPYRYPNNYFRISYLNDVDVPGQSFSINNKQAALSSFHTGKTDYWIYHKILQVAYIKEFENHFSFNTVLKNWNQQAAGTLQFQLSDPNNNTFIRNLTTTEIDIHLRYAPHEQLLQGTQERHTIHSKYPIFNAEIDHGFKGVLNGSYNYTNVSGSIYKRFYLSQLGYSDVTLMGGYIAGRVPFPLLNISPANQSIAYDPDAYNKMDYLEFVNDHYVGFNITQSFNGFLLNKVPLIQHLKLREFLSFKVLYGGLRNENNPAFSNNVYKFPTGSNGGNGTFALGNAPYTELGFGIGNIYKVLRVDLIKRYNYLDHPGVAPYGVKFSFQPDF